MSFQTIRNGFLIALCSVFLAACSSTGKDDGSASGATGGDGYGSGVSTGTADDGGAYGDDLSAGGTLATVFYFEFDSSTLKPEARAALNGHAQRLRSSPIYVRLEGHADERGSREYNMALGERRANSVKEFLVLQGVDGQYIEVISYGEERPAALGSDEGSWAMNRRVEIRRR
ncbi:MAG: peptidoglycan-associated lipoprotein Pal [Porticoccaceae bacterium]